MEVQQLPKHVPDPFVGKTASRVGGRQLAISQTCDHDLSSSSAAGHVCKLTSQEVEPKLAASASSSNMELEVEVTAAMAQTMK